MPIINTGGGILKASSTETSGRPLAYPFGVNRNRPLTVAHPPGVPCSVERIWNTSNGGVYCWWAGVETARGVYNWTVLDAVVADIQSRGNDIIYTFGYVPAWANGGLTPDVPPTSFTDFYNFVTAVVQRYAGKIKYDEAWNEPDLAGTAQNWSGTVAQMVTLATQVYALVHANDSTALACMPCVSGGIGGAWTSGASASSLGGLWLDQFLAAGGGVGADVATTHMYGTSTGLPNTALPTPVPAEVCWWALGWIQTVLANYGYAGLPLLITEGSWGETPTSAGYTLTTTDMQAWAVKWPALMQSAGAARALWFSADDTVWGEIWNGSAFTAAGTAYLAACSWLEGATFTAPIARQAASNQVSNPNGTTTAGSLPTGWSVSNPDVWGGYGMTDAYLGAGPNGGFLFRLHGTATTGAAGYYIMQPAAATGLACTPNQFWTFGCNVRLHAGSLANVSFAGLSAACFKSGGAYSSSPLYCGLSVTSYMTLAAIGLEINDANAAFIVPGLQIDYPVGSPVDLTIEIMGWVADTGSVWSGDIARPGGYKGRIVWDANGGPTTYTVPSWATYDRDATGALHSITGGTVTLTIVPVLLENQGR